LRRKDILLACGNWSNSYGAVELKNQLPFKEQLRVQQGEIEQGLKKIKIAKNRLLDLAERGALEEGDRAGVYIRKDNEAEWSFTIKGIFSGIDKRDFLPMEPWKANALLGIEDDNYNPFEKRELKSPNSGLKPLPLC
jgi:hypothetical protein